MALALVNLKVKQRQETAIKTAEINKKLPCGTCYQRRFIALEEQVSGQSAGSGQASQEKTVELRLKE